MSLPQCKPRKYYKKTNLYNPSINSFNVTSLFNPELYNYIVNRNYEAIIDSRVRPNKSMDSKQLKSIEKNSQKLQKGVNRDQNLSLPKVQRGQDSLDMVTKRYNYISTNNNNVDTPSHSQQQIVSQANKPMNMYPSSAFQMRTNNNEKQIVNIHYRRLNYINDQYQQLQKQSSFMGLIFQIIYDNVISDCQQIDMQAIILCQYKYCTFVHILSQSILMKVSIHSALLLSYFMLTIGCLMYKVYEQMAQQQTADNSSKGNNNTNNYFKICQNLFYEPLTKLLIYNVIICLLTMTYKYTVILFYQQIKQMEINNMLEKIGYKLFEFFYFVYVMQAQFGIEVFLAISIVFLLFVFHNLANFRAQYLIHTHTMDLMGLNYRLLAHFLVLIFIDFQLIVNTFFWLFSGSGQSNQAYILFAYYAITIGMTVVEPSISFLLHFYEIYTDIITPDSDLLKARLNYYINFTRLIIQIFLSLYIAMRFTIAFLFIITIFQSVFELSKIYKSYKQINKFAAQLNNFPTLNAEQISHIDDKTCAICYQDITVQAVVLKKCKHLFHRQCLRQWIIKNSNKFCPKCKTAFEDSTLFSGTTQQRQQLGRLANRIRQRIVEQEKNQQIRDKEDPLGFQYDEEKQNYRQSELGERMISRDDNKQAIKQNQLKRPNCQQYPKIKSTKAIKEMINDRKQTLNKKKIRQPLHCSKAVENRIGSIPFGLPTQAIYKRKSRDVFQRQKIITVNQRMIKLLKMQPTKQLLFVPEF